MAYVTEGERAGVRGKQKRRPAAVETAWQHAIRNQRRERGRGSEQSNPCQICHLYSSNATACTRGRHIGYQQSEWLSRHEEQILLIWDSKKKLESLYQYGIYVNVVCLCPPWGESYSHARPRLTYIMRKQGRAKDQPAG